MFRLAAERLGGRQISDIAIKLKNGRFDLVIVNGDLEPEDGFDTAIFMSLFTDARAASIQPAENQRGWIGNLASTVKGRQHGGLLWLLDQRRLTQETVNDAVSYATQALSWMTEDGIAKTINVNGFIIPRSGIKLEITITYSAGETAIKYLNLWEMTGG